MRSHPDPVPHERSVESVEGPEQLDKSLVVSNQLEIWLVVEHESVRQA